MNDRIRVRSPKSEHHAGKASRVIPLFPELRTILEDARALVADDAEYVVGGDYRKACVGHKAWRNITLLTQCERILDRAGIEAWPQLFHNLRSSRQAELAERFPSHVVCDWLGNSEDIARMHYYQTTEQHFAGAAGKAKQNPKQYYAATTVADSHRQSASPDFLRELSNSRKTPPP